MAQGQNLHKIYRNGCVIPDHPQGKPWVNEGAIIPTKPQCWKCDGFNIDTVVLPGQYLRECLDCGTQWRDKSGKYI